MSSVPISDRSTAPTRATCDTATRRIEIDVDVLAATRDDCTVAVGPDRVRIVVDHAAGEYDRTFHVPPGYAVGDEREAVYNNGVLSVRVDVRRRW